MRRLDRRSFLKVTGAQAALLALSRRAAAQPSSDVVVVGAGAFGGWTALSLREMGVPVTLLDAYGPGNSRASSGGETRQIRAGYEDRELYTRWVLEAFGRWKAREAEWGRRLLFETGRLLLAPEWNHGLETTKAALDKYSFTRDAYLQRRRAEIYESSTSDSSGQEPKADGEPAPQPGAPASTPAR